MVEGVEYISTKQDIASLVLGATHFFDMLNFFRMEKKAPPPASTDSCRECTAIDTLGSRHLGGWLMSHELLF